MFTQTLSTLALSAAYHFQMGGFWHGSRADIFLYFISAADMLLLCLAARFSAGSHLTVGPRMGRGQTNVRRWKLEMSVIFSTSIVN